MKEAASQRDIVEISISTRPDCIRKDYMEVLKQIKDLFCGNYVGIRVADGQLSYTG